MLWWMWIAGGVILMISEFVIPGFVVCFFGAGAVLTGIVAAIFSALGLTWEIAIFIVSSIVFTLVGRKLFHGGKVRDPNDLDDVDLSDGLAVVTEAIAPGHPGKVEFRGSFWTALAETEISVGTSVRILKRDNLTLTVKADR